MGLLRFVQGRRATAAVVIGGGVFVSVPFASAQPTLHYEAESLTRTSSGA